MDCIESLLNFVRFNSYFARVGSSTSAKPGVPVFVKDFSANFDQFAPAVHAPGQARLQFSFFGLLAGEILQQAHQEQ
jgi:hypothetical protein